MKKQLQPNKQKHIGVDVGGSKILALVIDDDAQVISKVKTQTPNKKELVLKAIGQTIEKLTVDFSEIASIGIGVPGLVDENGSLLFAPNLRHGEGLNYKDYVQEIYKINCCVNNDANCAAFAEWRAGNAKSYSNFVMVTLGTGIGGGLFISGELLKGSLGFAGEVGHMVIDPYGPLCPCGNRGCWERFASGTGLGRLARDEAVANKAPALVELANGDPEKVRGEDVILLAKKGVREAIKIIEDFAFWIAIGLANIAAVLDVQAFVIGGGVVEDSELWIEPVRKKFASLLLGSQIRQLPDIVASCFKENSGAIGAALLASKASFS